MNAPLVALSLSAAVVWVAAPRAVAQDLRPPPSSRPNVLLILADDLGYSDLSSYGGEIPTPNIDRLAAAGLRFTQCYNSARCCPSRAALMTGLYPHQAGIGSFATDQPDPERGPGYLGRLTDRSATLAEVLRSAGYSTWMVGKWHMERPGPIARGFDEFYGFTLGYEQDQWEPERYQRLPEGRQPERSYAPGAFYATDAFTDYALEFLSQARRRDGQPWFLYVAHSAPHFPVQAPPATVDAHVERYRRGWDELRAERFDRMRAIGLADRSWRLTGRSTVPVDRDDVTNGHSGLPNPAWDELPRERREDLARRMAVFAAMVEHVDRGVGRLVDDLEAHGELQNTVVLFLSDNGACYEWGPFGFDGPSRRGVTTLHTGDALDAMGGPGTYHAYGSGWASLCNTPFRLYKHFTHEGGICTPLIVHWPAGLARTDAWVRDPVHLIDLMPTLCELGGATYPARTAGGAPIEPMAGTSLVPAFGGEALAARDLVFEHQGARAIRRGRWKAVWSKRMPYEVGWELYDLQTDRCEAVDLSSERPELTSELADAWLAWARRVKVHPFFLPETADGEVETPEIAGLELSISCEVAARGADGVILAQGGRTHGYALHLDGGRVVFSVRIDRVLTELRGPALPATGWVRLDATLGRAAMELSIDGVIVARCAAPGLIPAQPADPLSVGRDERTAVGGYSAPHPLAGEVRGVSVRGR